MKPILEKYKINCGDCNNALIEIFVTEKNEELETPVFRRFVIKNCPNCGGSSFLTSTIGGTIFHNYLGNYLDSMTFHDDTDDGVPNIEISYLKKDKQWKA